MIYLDFSNIFITDQANLDYGCIILGNNFYE